MKALLGLMLSMVAAGHAQAAKSCESVVVPLALEMAKASGQGQLTQRWFIDTSADYTTITVTLGSESQTREGKFRMTMTEDFGLRGSCVVKSVEAL